MLRLLDEIVCLNNRENHFLSTKLPTYSKHLKDDKVWDRWQQSLNIALTFSWQAQTMAEVRHARIPGGKDSDQEELEQGRKNVENTTWSTGDCG